MFISARKCKKDEMASDYSDSFVSSRHRIKRREVAKTLCDNQCVLINGKAAKPASEIKENDEIVINSPNGRTIKIKIKTITNFATTDQAKEMYEVISQE